MNDDCIFCIFCELEIRNIVNCSLVCKQFNRVAKSEMIWLRLFKIKFIECVNKNFYDEYKRFSILDNFLLKNNRGNVNFFSRN